MGGYLDPETIIIPNNYGNIFQIENRRVN